MKMHHMKLKSALAKFGPMVATTSDDDLKVLLSDAANGFTQEEQEEVFAALKKGVEEPPKQTPEGGTSTVPQATTGSEIQIPDFEPADLANPVKFKEYVQWLLSIPGNTKLKFDLMKVESIREVRYEGVKDSPVDIVGIRIKDNKPYLGGTLIPVKHAVQHNGYIAEGKNWFALEGSQLADVMNTNKMFYIVKK